MTRRYDKYLMNVLTYGKKPKRPNTLGTYYSVWYIKKIRLRRITPNERRNVRRNVDRTITVPYERRNLRRNVDRTITVP